MAEGIIWSDLGTVDVTFEDKTYHLGRPKMRQFRYFTRKLEEQSREVTEELDRLQREIADAQQQHEDDSTPEARADLDRLTARLREFSRNPFYDRTIGIIGEMFEQMGDPLPSDPDDWPAWLAADSSLPGEILKHWRSHPKASGSNGTE